jgi:hypothetical protein
VDPRDTEHLLEWCRLLHRDKPLPAERRFSIGVYQLGQALRWMDGPVNWQSYAAAAIHFATAASAAGLSVASHLPDGLEEPLRFAGWRELVASIGLAQQHLVYHEETNPRWRSRYDEKTTEAALGTLVEQSLALIPQGERASAVFDEMTLIAELRQTSVTPL